ncbi:MAG: hypothetical protein WC479_06065 [Candidatus Izemoplasmatales bacterium]|jgi:hypothetical protein
MNDLLYRFLQELAANLFFMKNFFLFFESIIHNLPKTGTSSGNPLLVMTLFSFWNEMCRYFVRLFRLKKDNAKGFDAVINRLSTSAAGEFAGYDWKYLSLMKQKYDDFLISHQEKLSILEKACANPGKTIFSNMDVALANDMLFDSIVFSNELYVGFSNLLGSRNMQSIFHPKPTETEN